MKPTSLEEFMELENHVTEASNMKFGRKNKQTALDKQLD
jgi:hypothetical protein